MSDALALAKGTRPTPAALSVTALTTSISRSGGGVSEALRELSQALVRGTGCSVRVLAGRDDAASDDLRLWGGVPVDVLATAGPRTFGYASGLGGALALASPDIVHVHGLWSYASLAAPRWAARVRRPYVVSPHGMLDAWALASGRAKKQLAWFAFEAAHLRGAGCLHALCEAEYAAIRACGWTNPVCIVPNGVAVPSGPAPPPPDWARALHPGERVLLFLGRIHPKKNVASLLTALARLGAGHGWRLVVAGWDQGGHEAELRRLAAALSLGGEVIFAGPQFGADREASLRAADAFVLPSLSEGQPMAVLEAWARGLPVVMTRQCNLPLGFSAGAAIPAEPDAEALADALAALMALSGEDRRAMGARGARLVGEGFTWAAAATRMEAVYRWLASGGPAPDCVRR